MTRSKLCPHCLVEKALYCFSPRQRACKPCRSVREAKRQKHPDAKERRSLRERERYLSDPIYAEKERAASRAYYWRVKVCGSADAI